MLGSVCDPLFQAEGGSRPNSTSDRSTPPVPDKKRVGATGLTWLRLVITCGLLLVEIIAGSAVGNDWPANETALASGRAINTQPAGAQVFPGCLQVIYNSGLDQGYGWTTYFPAVTVEEGAGLPSSLPGALRMTEYPPDGFKPPFAGDSDGFGQRFHYPNLMPSSFVIDYQLKYLDIGPVDEVHYAIFEVDATTGELLGNPIFDGVAPNDISYHDQQWHHEQVVTDYSAPVHDLLKGKEVALVFYTSTNDSPSYLDVLIDDVQLKICATAAAPTGRISGTVTQRGGPSAADGVSVVLYHDSPGNDRTVAAEGVVKNGGNYEFRNVPALPPGESYQIGFANRSTGTERLGLWLGPLISSFGDGNHVGNIDFDITNVELVSPTHEAAVTFPAAFNWNGRGRTGEKYDLCLSDTQSLAETCPKMDLIDTTATVTQNDIEPGFGFAFDKRYVWFVRVKSGTGMNGADYGESYFASAITFVATSNEPPGSAPPPSGVPPGGNGSADWTVMIYIAGDNNLGDPNRYYDPSLNLQGQFASLKQLARDHPGVNLVTLTDFYDESGTEYCHLKPDGTQACQQLGEADTSDPLILSSFISNTVSLFPAAHTMLIISDHGHGIAGVAADETTDRSAVMSPDELRYAYQAAGLDANKLDVLFYNACLMGSLEAAFDASFFADYLVASADELWVLNVYERLLPMLSDPTTKTDPKAVAQRLPLAYQQSVAGVAPGYFVSSAAYDLAHIPAVSGALSTLAAALADELHLSRTEIESMRAQVQLYDSSGNFELGPEDAFVDLVDLAQRLEQVSGRASIASAAASLSAALPPLILSSSQVTGDNGLGAIHDLSNASGLSVYFPNGHLGGEQPTLTNLYLNRGIYQQYLDQTEWDEFIRLYIAATLSGGPGRLESATRPISGALPYRGEQFLPMIMVP